MLNLEEAGWNRSAMGDVDHRIVKAPYVRLDSVKEGESGDYVFKYDLRFTQPNKIFLASDVAHSLEHFLLVEFRKKVKSFVGVAPMGCHTGFYLFLLNEYDASRITQYLEEALVEILSADEVPLSTEVTCGHAASHNLAGSKEAAKAFLKNKDKWLDIF